MANSYLLCGALAGLHVRIAAPDGFQPDPAMVRRAGRIADTTGGSVAVTDAVHDAAIGADVLATDTWVSMGMEQNRTDPEAVFGPYALDGALLERANSDAIVLHCLPAYRGKEISADVIDGPASRVWDEAENRRHVQKAVLAFLDEQARW
jgi:ornithine carbamoyltransferase